jgi:signal transduction histidine kinase
MDLGKAVRDAVDEMAAAYPESVMEFKSSGDLQGSWDAARISQAMANLLGNAVQHGAEKALITVTAEGAKKEVVLSVHNSGPSIPRADMHGLFNPLKRLKAGENPVHDSSNLGLGLYIAERIVSAHGGTIEVKSSDNGGTSFAIHLPR